MLKDEWRAWCETEGRRIEMRVIWCNGTEKEGRKRKREVRYRYLPFVSLSASKHAAGFARVTPAQGTTIISLISSIHYFDLFMFFFFLLLLFW